MTTRPPGLLRRVFSPAGILVLATLVRLAFILTMGNKYYFADTAEYEARAIDLLQGHGLGSTLRAPLYPLFMALGILLGGPGNYLVLRLLQLVLAIGGIWLTGRVARRLGGRPAELIAMVVVAFSPTMVFSSGMLYPTTLYSLLLLAITALALRLGEKPALGGAVALGLMLPLAWLTDPVSAAPAAAVLAWLLARVRGAGAPMAAVTAVALVVAGAIVAPYLMVQARTGSGSSAFMQKAQYVLHFARTDTTMSRQRQVRLPPETPYEQLGAGGFLKREWRLFRAMPGAYAHDVAFEFMHFFKPMPDRVQTQNRYNRGYILWIGAIAFVPVLALAVLGLFYGAPPLRRRLLLAMIVLATAGFYSLFFTQARYRIPIEPQLAILAALGLQRLFPRLAAFAAGEPGPKREAA